MDELVNSVDYIPLNGFGYVRKDSIVTVNGFWIKYPSHYVVIVTLINGVILKGTWLSPVKPTTDILKEYTWSVVSPSKYPSKSELCM